MPRVGQSESALRVNATNPGGGNAESIQDAAIFAIGCARRHVYVENAYLTDREVLRALAQAAQRGVDVKVLFPQDNHHRFASAASEFSYKELLEAGVKIYERPGMFHTKAISVDGQWASIGSGNLMSMLEQTQKELNLDFQDDSTPAQLNRVLFEPDVKKSVQVTLENMGNHVAPLPARAVSKGLDSLISVTEEAKQKLKNWLF